MENQNQKERDLTIFKRFTDEIIAKDKTSWDSLYSNYLTRSEKLKDYTLEEVDKIINSNSLTEQQTLSRNYYLKDGFYKRIILHYATLLKYMGILIPNPTFGHNLSEENIIKRYNVAMNYIEKMKLPELLTSISINALVYGRYYGVIQTLDKGHFVLIDLPSNYCTSDFKDLEGNDLIQFDVSYFDTIRDERIRNIALKNYPKEIRLHYKNYKNSKKDVPKTMIIKPETGVCFSFFTDGRPLFLNVIPSTIQYGQAVDLDMVRNVVGLKKIIVQHIPHLNDGTLVFEPEEALEMHRGAVNMMKGNDNTSVLTTYADVDSISANPQNESTSNSIENMRQNVYNNASASPQLFSPTGNSSIDNSLQNDLALMMILANKYSSFITYIVNKLFANTYVNFKYTIFPISWHNEKDYISDGFKLAQSGYSFFIPALAMGFSQRDLNNIKDLENDVLHLRTKLYPLQSAYTLSSKVQGDPDAMAGAMGIKDSNKEDVKKEIEEQEEAERKATEQEVKGKEVNTGGNG